MADDSFLPSPSLSSVPVSQKSSASSTSPPGIPRCVHEVRAMELAGAGLSGSALAGPRFLDASAAQQARAWLSCGALTGLNARSVGGSGYRTKHSLTFLLKRVGSGFCLFFFNCYYCCML